MTDHECWLETLQWRSWTVEPENLEKFLERINSATDSGSWNKPYYDATRAVIKAVGSAFVFVAPCADYPYIKNQLSSIARYGVDR